MSRFRVIKSDNSDCGISYGVFDILYDGDQPIAYSEIDLTCVGSISELRDILLDISKAMLLPPLEESEFDGVSYPEEEGVN